MVPRTIQKNSVDGQLTRPDRNGPDPWEIWGNYTHAVQRTNEGWKCTGTKFVVTHTRGNEMARDYLPGQ